ncbi:MAG: valine--tRNA ligase [Crocinitomicaceae bacterium]|jgi:valyl-tRNA synthetase|nr:valine--tRNA ligase [Crocinitomicaceae bacterium]
MDIPKKYEPQKTEDKWYKHWTNQGFFNSEPDDREAYTVVMPPPNVTGVLHMGHMLNNTIQDVLVRRARMLGKNACWVPGTDHASIATEAKVVAKLKQEGIEKLDLTRDEFLQHAWDWTEKHGGIILEQLKKIGASCDWKRTRFTMDKDYYDSVVKVFIDLFRKGYIYRGVRMVNWDPEALTALSDEEVNHKEVNSKLYYIRYKVDAVNDDWITIATTRPETILGDSAICINPNDKRYTHLKGKKVFVPLINREIPIIFDEYVDPEFGTGCLKVTPAHDPNDYELGLKYNLESFDILADNGSLNETAQLYIGQDRFTVRKQIAIDLEEQGYLVKSEDHINKIGFSERTDAIIEPKLSLQWFCAMEDLSKPALDNVMNDSIQFHPAKFKNSYRHWMENIKDWCVSRQLWWGHQIPAYYYGKGPKDFVVASSLKEALTLAKEQSGNTALKEADIKQDEDVLDTWFSSWLWPMSVFNGFEEGADKTELDYYYPTNDLVTAPEIMFFWVARMIVAGYEYKNELPFKNVYYTGIVRDKLGRKMSKSLGNSPDPFDLIQKYGADGVRVGMLLSSPAGNDLPFDSSQCEQGRNFTNKIWNAFRLITSWEVKNFEQPKSSSVANDWLASKLSRTILDLNEQFEKFRISEALMTTYKFVWDDFCSLYLEMIKPGYQQPIDQSTYNEAVKFFEIILKLIHPFTPFIAEEIWHLIKDRTDKDCVVIASWPVAEEVDDTLLSDFIFAEEIISNVRNTRKEKNIANKVLVDLVAKENETFSKQFDPIIEKLGNLSSLTYTSEKVDNAFSFIVKSNEYFIPFSAEVDVAAEIAKIKDELKYIKGFLIGVEKKLSNQRFVDGAPKQVVNVELKKQADAKAKIKVLEEKLLSFA